MDSSHELRVALIKIRLMADIARSAQCKVDECDMILEMVADLANNVLNRNVTDVNSCRLSH